jgi:hypothetical protein
VPKPAELTRDEKVENLIMNFSMIMMGMFEGVFTAIAKGLAEVMSKMTDAIAEGLGTRCGRRTSVAGIMSGYLLP